MHSCKRLMPQQKAQSPSFEAASNTSITNALAHYRYVLQQRTAVIRGIVPQQLHLCCPSLVGNCMSTIFFKSLHNSPQKFAEFPAKVCRILYQSPGNSTNVYAILHKSFSKFYRIPCQSLRNSPRKSTQFSTKVSTILYESLPNLLQK